MKQDSYAQLLAQRLSSLTKESGKSIKELAKEIDISVGALSNYQNGKAEPGLTALCAIADYFQVPVDWLVGRSQVRDPEAAEAEVCEYLKLSHEAVRFLRDLTYGSQIEEGRVQSAEISNWLCEQKEFQELIISIWIAVMLEKDRNDHELEPQFQKHLQAYVERIQDPKYIAMSSLVHLLDDRVEDFLKRRRLNG